MSETVPRITVSPGKAQALRERAQACLGVALILGLIGMGVGVSGEHGFVAVLLGLGCVAFLAAFGIVWDLQTTRPDEPRVSFRVAALTLTPQVAVVIVALLSLAKLVPPMVAVAVLFVVLCGTGLARTLNGRKAG